MNTEIFEKLLNLTGSTGGEIVFMPVISRCQGFMITEKVKYTGADMEALIHLAEQQGVSVRFLPFGTYDGRLKASADEVRIGIRAGMDFDGYVYNLAHELSHYFLHYDKGDTIRSVKHAEYEEQADRAAHMLLAALSLGSEPARKGV